MTGDEINKVIDKLAEKAGVAVDKMQPVAEELILQVQNRGLIIMIVFSVIILIVMSIAALLEYKTWNRKEGWGAFLLLATGISFICLLGFILGLIQYVAPLATILEV